MDTLYFWRRWSRKSLIFIYRSYYSIGNDTFKDVSNFTIYIESGNAMAPSIAIYAMAPSIASTCSSGICYGGSEMTVVVDPTPTGQPSAVPSCPAGQPSSDPSGQPLSPSGQPNGQPVRVGCG